MKFTLKFTEATPNIIFDDLEFGEIFYEETYNIVDSNFKCVNKSQLNEIMKVYNQNFKNDNEGGTPAQLIREGGMSIIGRIYIYPTNGLNAKIHITVKN